MDEEALKALDKEVKRLKRLAVEQASQLHDLIENRLPAAFEELPAMAQATYDACRAWHEAHTRFNHLQKG